MRCTNRDGFSVFFYLLFAVAAIAVADDHQQRDSLAVWDRDGVSSRQFWRFGCHAGGVSRLFGFFVWGYLRNTHWPISCRISFVGRQGDLCAVPLVVGVALGKYVLPVKGRSCSHKDYHSGSCDQGGESHGSGEKTGYKRRHFQKREGFFLRLAKCVVEKTQKTNGKRTQ